MIAYEILKPIIDNTIHLSLTHVTKEDIAVLDSMVYYNTAGITAHKLQNNGFMIEIPESFSDLKELADSVSYGLYSIFITAMNIDVKYILFTVDGHEVDYFPKYI